MSMPTADHRRKQAEVSVTILETPETHDLGDNVALGASIRVGKKCVISSGVTRGDNTLLGQGCDLRDRAVIGANVSIGKDATVLADGIVESTCRMHRGSRRKRRHAVPDMMPAAVGTLMAVPHGPL
jgi:UDP-3-O-[3-hydroxymyristoyl] glucosamine N-acyltransferase